MSEKNEREVNERDSNEPRFAYEGLDRVIHERARLSVLTSMLGGPHGVTFVDLKKLCGLTDGNLSRHLQVLEAEGMVKIEKGYDKNRPQTLCQITVIGRKRYAEYLTVLERVVRDAAKLNKAAMKEGSLLTSQEG